MFVSFFPRVPDGMAGRSCGGSLPHCLVPGDFRKSEMDNKTIYSKTGKGVLEIKNKAGKLPRDLVKVLTLIDGKSTVADLMAKSKLSDSDVNKALGDLTTGGYIKEFTNTSTGTASSGGSYVDDLDFTSSLSPGKNVYQNAQTEWRQRETADRAKAEAETKRKREEEERLKKEQASKQAREEGVRLAKVEAERKAKEAAGLKLREEAERKAKLEAEAMSQTQRDLSKILEAERKAFEQAERKKLDEQQQKAKEEVERRGRDDAERKVKDEEERKRKEEAELKRRNEEDRKRADDEVRKRREDEERKKREEEERKKREEEDRRRREEEERKRKEEEDRKRREEEQRKEEERKEEERKRKEEEERKRREEEERRKREEEERKRKEEEERKRREEEDRRKREEDERKRREEEERRQKEEEERKRKEEEERIRAEEERKRKEEEERRKREDEEKRARREEEDRRRHEEDERRQREDAEAARASGKDSVAEREAEERRLRDEEDRKRRAEEDELRQREENERNEREIADRHRREEDDRTRAEADRHGREDDERRERDEAHRRREEEDSRRKREEDERAKQVAAKNDLPEFDLSGLRAMETTVAAEFEKQQEELRRREEEEERNREQVEQARMAMERAEREAQAREEAERREAEDLERRERMERERQDREARERKRQEEKEARVREQEEAKVKREQERQRQEAMKVENQRRSREDDLAKRRKEQEERDRKRAEVDSLKKNKGIKTPLDRLKPVIIGVVALAAVVIGGVQLVPMNSYVPSIEKLASQHIKEPVSIGSMHVSILGGFNIVLQNVRLGTTQDVKIDKVSLSPEFGSVFGDVKIIRKMEVESVTVAEEVLPRLPKWLDAAVTDKRLEIDRMVIKSIKIESHTVKLPAFDANLQLSPEGAIERAVLVSTDGKLNVEVTPRDGQIDIALSASKGWLPPVGPQIEFTDLTVKAVATHNQIRVEKFESLLYGGAAKGSALIVWGGPWSLDGEVETQRIGIQGLMEVFTRDARSTGQLEAKLRYSMSSQGLTTLFDSPKVDGSFDIKKGDLDGVDLVRALQSGGRGVTQGGATRFEEISGTVALNNGRYQYRNMKLSSGLLSAAGAFDVSPNKDVSGRIAVELRSQAAQIRGNYVLDGDLKAIALRPN